MSYLDPIRKQLDEAMPIREGGWRALCWALCLAAIPFSIWGIIAHTRVGWTHPDPWRTWAELLWSVALIGSTAAIGGGLYYSGRHGLPATFKLIDKSVRGYYRRNIIGYRLMIDLDGDGNTSAWIRFNPAHRRGGDPGIPYCFALALGGWRKSSAAYLQGGKLPWRISILSFGEYEVYVRLAFDGRHFVFLGASELLDLLQNYYPRLPSGLNWDSVIRDLVCQNRETLDQAEVRVNGWIAWHLTLLGEIAATKRFQHSKEAEQLLFRAMSRLIPALAEDDPRRTALEADLVQLKERIAKREAATVKS